MAHNGDGPGFYIEGMREVIERDLSKHKALLEQTQRERVAYSEARSHEIKRKKHYRSLIGGGKFNDDALKNSIQQINLNIRHLSDKFDAATEKMAHHTLIVDRLTSSLDNHDISKQWFEQHQRRRGSASNN